MKTTNTQERLIVIALLAIILVSVASVIYTQTQCLRWEDHPTNMTCYTYGDTNRITHCEPQKQCVEWRD